MKFCLAFVLFFSCMLNTKAHTKFDGYYYIVIYNEINEGDDFYSKETTINVFFSKKFTESNFFGKNQYDGKYIFDKKYYKILNTIRKEKGIVYLDSNSFFDLKTTFLFEKCFDKQSSLAVIILKGNSIGSYTIDGQTTFEQKKQKLKSIKISQFSNLKYLCTILPNWKVW